MVSLAVISTLQLQVSRSTAIIQGIGGEADQSIAAYLNLTIGDITIRAVKVYGYSGDLLNNQIILGRNVLNQCCIEFDGTIPENYIQSCNPLKLTTDKHLKTNPDRYERRSLFSSD